MFSFAVLMKNVSRHIDIVNIPDQSIMEWYPLHLAVMHDETPEVEMVKAIMDLSWVNLNAEDHYQETPYDYAHRHGKYQVLDLFYSRALDENSDYTLPIPLQWIEEWHQPIPNAWILALGNLNLDEAFGHDHNDEAAVQDHDDEAAAQDHDDEAATQDHDDEAATQDHDDEDMLLDMDIDMDLEVLNELFNESF